MVDPLAFHDIAKLARKRCRASTELSLQLLDTNQEAAVLLLAVAADLVYGAASFLGDDRTIAVDTARTMLDDALRKIEKRAKDD
jgi:hypothetical protein